MEKTRSSDHDPAEDEGDVISVNGAAAVVEDPEGDPPKEATPEDRGDIVTVTEAEPATPAQAPAAATLAAKPPADDEVDGEGKPMPTGFIPRFRYNETKSKLDTTQEELLRTQRELLELRTNGTTAAPPAPVVKPPAFDADAKEKEYIDAVVDNDTDKALAIRKEINAHLVRTAETSFESRMNHNVVINTMQEVATNAVTAYPYLDTDEGEAAMDAIMASRDRKAAAGMPLPQALQEAVEAIAPRFAPVGTVAPTNALQNNQKKADTRTVTAMTRGAASSTQQPAQLVGGAGNRTTEGRVDVADMSEEQFETLTKEQKRRLRGD